MGETTEASGAAPAFAGRHEPRPLPFDPAKLTGMSERLIRSHWENNYWAWDHGNGAPGSRPLLVLDMYEHAYHLDYGAAAARYVDAFMRNVHWEEVSRRLVEATASLGTRYEGRDHTSTPG